MNQWEVAAWIVWLVSLAFGAAGVLTLALWGEVAVVYVCQGLNPPLLLEVLGRGIIFLSIAMSALRSSHRLSRS